MMHEVFNLVKLCGVDFQSYHDLLLDFDSKCICFQSGMIFGIVLLRINLRIASSKHGLKPDVELHDCYVFYPQTHRKSKKVLSKRL